MRVGTGGEDAPPPHTHCCADEQLTSGEGRSRPPAPINDDLATRGELPPSIADRPESSAGLIDRATSSWPATWRVVTLLVVLVVLVGGLLLIVPADIELGPFRISPR